MITGRGKADWIGFFLVSTHYSRIRGLWCNSSGETRAAPYPRVLYYLRWSATSSCMMINSASEDPGEFGGSAQPIEVPSGVEATSPSEDQGVCLAPATATTDDEIPTAAFGTARSSGMPVVRQGSGGLPALILRLPLSRNSVAGDRRRQPCGDLGGGILAVARWHNILPRSRVADYFCHTLVPLDP